MTTALHQPDYFDGEPKAEEIIAVLTDGIRIASIEQNEVSLLFFGYLSSVEK